MSRIFHTFEDYYESYFILMVEASLTVKHNATKVMCNVSQDQDNSEDYFCFVANFQRWESELLN